jgi:hypothetical protein
LLPFDLDHFRRRTAMYLPVPNYDTVVAYLYGIDVAMQGGFLKGFDEWLFVGLGADTKLMQPNLPWNENILRLAGKRSRMPGLSSVDGLEDRAMIDNLFELLERFLECKNKKSGLREIYVKYNEWLTSQDWYDPRLDQ